MKESTIKILHVTFTMGIGGTEQVIRQIIENSDASKYSHEILCIDGEIGPLGIELQQNGIHIEKTQRQAGTDRKLIQFIRALVKRRNVDVLHCHQYTPYFYGVLSVLWMKTKVIFTEHGRFYPDRHNFKRRFINPLLFLATDSVTAISASTADAVALYEYFPRQKIQVIYNGINDLNGAMPSRDELLQELDLSDEYRYVGTISRLEPIKNQSMMIKSFAAAKQKVENLRLIIIGDGVKMNDLKAQAKSLKLEQDVIFTGFLNNPQRFIELFEVFLLSSFSEGTSMTLLEAMSLSKPCVVTDVGGNPEIVEDNITGLISPSDDSELFSNSIEKILMNKKVCMEYGKAGRDRYLKNYIVSHMIDSYHALYCA